MKGTERVQTREEIDSFHRKRYEFAAQFVSSKRVLDAACGIGYGSAMLAEAGAVSVIGMDISTQAIAVAQSEYQRVGVEFQTGDCLAAGGTYDIVVSLETIEHLAEGHLWPAKIASLLAPNGVAVISTPVRKPGMTLEWKPGNPYHVREWSADEFRSLLEAAFAGVKLHFQGFLIPEVHGTVVGRTLRRALTGFQLRNAVMSADTPVCSLDDWFERYGCRPGYMIAVCTRTAGPTEDA